MVDIEKEILLENISSLRYQNYSLLSLKRFKAVSFLVLLVKHPFQFAKKISGYCKKKIKKSSLLAKNKTLYYNLEPAAIVSSYCNNEQEKKTISIVSQRLFEIDGDFPYEFRFFLYKNSENYSAFIKKNREEFLKTDIILFVDEIVDIKREFFFGLQKISATINENPVVGFSFVEKKGKLGRLFKCAYLSSKGSGFELVNDFFENKDYFHLDNKTVKGVPSPLFFMTSAAYFESQLKHLREFDNALEFNLNFLLDCSSKENFSKISWSYFAEISKFKLDRKKFVLSTYFNLWRNLNFSTISLKDISENSDDENEVKKFKVQFIVTECGPDVAAGDYFTAKELGDCLETLGWEVGYIADSGENIEVSTDVDAIICMLDSTPAFRVNSKNTNLIKVAWARNWFVRWQLQGYTLVLCSSKLSADFFKIKNGLNATVFPIATNDQRFFKPIRKDRPIDCVFTGSFWGKERELIKYLSSFEIDFKLEIYGKNWEQVPSLNKYFKGFLKYSDIPSIYSKCKIVIDDANLVTKDFGSVNSRVFDAIASGCLVLTNGSKGSREIFNSLLPTYSSAIELKNKIHFFLSHENERLRLVEQLQSIVLSEHTYCQRAKALKEIFYKQGALESSNLNKIAILICTPFWKDVKDWGDFYLAFSLAQELEKQGFEVEIRPKCSWYKPFDGRYTIMFRGLDEYFPDLTKVNILWVISHPDEVSNQELLNFNFVFASSNFWAKKKTNELKQMGFKNREVIPLMQFTTFSSVQKQQSEKLVDVLFVGNTRGVERKAVTFALKRPNTSLAIFGRGWKGKIPPHLLYSEHISNANLQELYGRATVLINDHWEDMAANGFVSNRVFDGLMSGAMVLTDWVRDVPPELSKFLFFYKNEAEFNSTLDELIGATPKKDYDSAEAKLYIQSNHTAKQRAEFLLRLLGLTPSTRR